MGKTAVDFLELELIKFGVNVHEVSVLIAIQQAKEQEEQRIIDFAKWYSGMEEIKVKKAYERYLKESINEALQSTTNI